MSEQYYQRWSVPAQHNPRLIDAALPKVKGSNSDSHGCCKGVWYIGRKRGLVLKRTDMYSAWRELYPQFYSPLARQVIQPYRAWAVKPGEWGRNVVYLLQGALDIYGPEYPDQVDPSLNLKRQLYAAMGGVDVNWTLGCYRNCGYTRKGKVKVYDFGCGRYDVDYDSVTLEDGYLVGNCRGMTLRTWENGFNHELG